MKRQLLIVNRSRRRAPRLSAFHLFQLGFWSLFLGRRHIQRAAVIIRPSTLFKFHDIFKKRKYRLLYSSARRTKPGPKGPSPELVRAIVGMKQHNPRFGCRRIAMQITDVFGIDIDKDLVRRVLDNHYRPRHNGGGPSWLTFRPYKKQPVVHGPISLRVDSNEKPLGAGGNGPIYASHYWLRRACRRRRWHRPVPHV
jgi:putative transposase